MKEKILIVLLFCILMVISSCSSNLIDKKEKSVYSDSPVDIQENTVQPNY